MSFLAFLSEGVGAFARERIFGRAHILRVQQRRLSALVRRAAEMSPLYQGLYAGIDPQRFELAQLPAVDKQMLLDNFGNSITESGITLEEARRRAEQSTGELEYIRGRYLLATTSGTTGQVGVFLFSKASWARQLGLLFSRILRERLAPRYVLRILPWQKFRVALVGATGGPFVSQLVSGFASGLVGVFSRARPFSITAPLAETVRGLNAYRPHYIHGYPTYIEMLARAQIEGELAIQPKVISLSSEPVSALARDVIARAFPEVQIREVYGATECVAMACRCRVGSLHVNEDACVLEAVDDDGRPVAPGVLSSKVYVTNLLSDCQPLLRYEISDQVRYQTEPCPCGSPLAHIEVIGRADDTIHLRDAQGRLTAHPPIPFEVLFLQVAGVRQYQLVHSEQNALQVRYVPERADDGTQLGERLRRAFAEYLEKHGLAGEVQVSLKQVLQIERDPRTQKIRQIVSEVSAPGGDRVEAGPGEGE